MKDASKSETVKAPKRCASRLTVARFKRIQDFKRVRGSNLNIYGRLGSPKWVDELHEFLADKRISREDIQYWIETESEVTEPLPEINKSKPKPYASYPEQLFSATGRALRTCRLAKVQRSPAAAASDHSSTSSTDTPGSGSGPGPTITIPSKAHHSKKNRDNQALVSPNPAANSEEFEDFILPNFGDGVLNDIKTQKSMPPLLKHSASSVFIPQQPEVPVEQMILKDVETGLAALQTLTKLTKKYENVQPSFVPQIRYMYQKFEELGKIIVVPEIPQPYSLALGVKQEMDSGETMWEYIEIDGNTTNSPGGDRDPRDLSEEMESGEESNGTAN